MDKELKSSSPKRNRGRYPETDLGGKYLIFEEESVQLGKQKWRAQKNHRVHHRFVQKKGSTRTQEAQLRGRKAGGRNALWGGREPLQDEQAKSQKG